MKQTLKTITLTAALSLAASFASAATAYTEPVGALSITCPAGSDTIVGVPFSKAADFQGAATSINATSGVITTSASFTTNQFQNLWYVRFTSGALAGRYYTITANDATTVTVNKNGEDWSLVANTDSFKIVKYWLVGELFPPATQTTFTISANNTALARRSTLLIPDVNATGTNLSAGKILFVKSAANGGWTNTSGNTVANNETLLPDSYFIIRHRSADPATTYVPSGSVETSGLVTNFNWRSGGTNSKQDNPYFIARPVNYTLNQLSFGASFVDSTNTTALGRRDELFVFDNSIVATNKSASKIYFRTGGTWRSTAAPTVDAGGDSITAGAGVIVRKVGQTSAGTTFYSNASTY